MYKASSPEDAMLLADAGINVIVNAWAGLHNDIADRKALLSERYWKVEAAMALFKGNLPPMAPLSGDALRCDEAARGESAEAARCMAALDALLAEIRKQEELLAPAERRKVWIAV